MDTSLMKAVKCYFSHVRHKLCSSQLLGNAEMKVGHPKFTKLFKNCILQDYEINEFEAKWKAMVDECGVNHIKWVQGIYEKKHWWATAYTRGKFFIGSKGSSRCKDLLMQVEKFVHCRFSLYELVKNINHCLEFELRPKVDNDLKFGNEEHLLKTELKLLEKSGSLVFTRHIFDKYQTMLKQSYMTKVLETKNTPTSTVFIVGEYCKPSLKWTVSFYPEAKEFKCSCFCMESFGVPCSHIIKVMIFLDMTELPKSLILNRWTKNAKDSFVDEAESKMNAEHGSSNRKRKTIGGENTRPGKKDGQLIGTSAQFEKHLGFRQ